MRPTETGSSRPSADAKITDMESLLEQMSFLADQAGDWRGHLPYAAALGYLDDSEYRKEYGSHVDECGYCQQLIDTLHPREENVSRFLDRLYSRSAIDERVCDASTALSEARSALDAIRHVLVTSNQHSGAGMLENWANAQRWLADAQEGIEGADSVAPDPWSANIALSHDMPCGPASPNTVGDWIATEVEQVASFLLSFGFRVAHAGDLRSGGISERLFRIARQYGRRISADLMQPKRATASEVGYGVTSYCAWPVHIGMPIEERETYAMNFGRSGYVHFLTLDGEPHSYTHFSDSVRHEPAPNEWVEGLASLRDRMFDESHARVVIGGEKGVTHELIHSLAQDALSSLRNRQPLYILAGFGGCARDIALALQLTESPLSSVPKWEGVEKFAPYIGAESLCNGLDAAENQSLVETDDIEEAMQLVLLGLDRVTKGQQSAAQPRLSPRLNPAVLTGGSRV